MAPAAESEELESKDSFSTTALHTQVLLDRLLLSPGSIDGIDGQNMASAVKEFQHGRFDVSGKLDEKTSRALIAAWRDAQTSEPVAATGDGGDDPLQSPDPAEDPFAKYTISEADAKTSFSGKLPKDMAQLAKLPALNYADMQEMLAERFHCTPELLKRLNPDAQWQAGEVVSVPNVLPTLIQISSEKGEKSGEAGKKDKSTGNKDGSDSDKAKVPAWTVDTRTSLSAEHVKGPVTIIISKEDTTLIAVDKRGELVFHAPITAGSEHDPLPLGEWKVNGTEMYPEFHYNPDLFWDAEDDDEKARIPPGPNNPVGVAWVDISKPHYGLHGTPEPSTIGYSESHGCVRLTNWDVIRLSKMVKPDTKVYMVETVEDRRAKASEIKKAIEREKSDDEKQKGS